MLYLNHALAPAFWQNLSRRTNAVSPSHVLEAGNFHGCAPNSCVSFPKQRFSGIQKSSGRHCLSGTQEAISQRTGDTPLRRKAIQDACSQVLGCSALACTRRKPATCVPHAWLAHDSPSAFQRFSNGFFSLLTFRDFDSPFQGYSLCYRL